MTRLLLALAFVVASGTMTRAQSTALDPDLALRAHRGIPDTISYGTAGVSVGLETWRAWKVDQWRGVERVAINAGLVVAVSEVIKRIVHRTRPDGSDNLSFWSEHTALACLSHSRWGLTFCAATGAGRIAAGRHYLTDAVTGAAVGTVIGLRH